MLKIRLTRVGRKHDPTYRLVVVDSRKASQSGAYLENLGFYNPRKVGKEKKVLMSDFKEKADRIKYWISQGAQLSGTAHNLLVEAKVIEGKKVNVFTESKKKIAKRAEKATVAEESSTEEAKTDKPAEETPKEENKEAPTLTPTESEDQNRESPTSQPNQDDLGEVGKEKQEEKSEEKPLEKEAPAEESAVAEKNKEDSGVDPVTHTRV